METKLKFGVEGDLRSLAVEIVDALWVATRPDPRTKAGERRGR